MRNTSATHSSRYISSLFSLLPAGILRDFIGISPLVAYYHLVSDVDVPHVKHLYPVRSVRQFEKDLETFLQLFELISLQDLIENVRSNRPLPVNALLLTFDDGFREMAEIVAPILRRNGISATFFLNTAFLDNADMAHDNKISLLIDHLDSRSGPAEREATRKALFDYQVIDSGELRQDLLGINYRKRHVLDEIARILGIDFQTYLSVQRPYLAREEVARLVAEGFAIGAHSVDHPRYSDLSLQEQVDQTTRSLRTLREHFSLRYAAFAFPYGDVPDEFIKKIFMLCDVEVSFGTHGVSKNSNRRHFQRFSMDYDHASAKQILNRNYARNFYKRTTASPIGNHF